MISVAGAMYYEIVLGFLGSIFHRGSHHGYASAYAAPRG